MSDDQDKKQEPYTNLDLETAEQLFIAAGQRDQARAMYHLTQGWRNMFQGEFGQSFVNAMDRIVGGHIQPLVDGQAGLRELMEGNSEQIKKLAAEVGDQGQTLAAVVGDLSDVKEAQADQAQIIASVVSRITTAEQRITSAEQRIVTNETEISTVKAETVQLRKLLTQLSRDKEAIRRIAEEHGGES